MLVFKFNIFYVKDYYSWRNKERGSWFIQELCRQLEENAYNEHLLVLLTTVCREIATQYASNVPNKKDFDNKKQMPFVCSTLIKLCHFENNKKKSKKLKE